MKKKISIFLVIILILLLAVLFSQKGKAEPPEEISPVHQTEATDSADAESAEAETQTNPENIEEPDSSADDSWEDLPEAGADSSLPPVIVTPNVQPKPVTEYENYLNMTQDEQNAFIDSFESVDAFLNWHKQAKAEYDSYDNAIYVDGNTVIDFGG